MLIDTHIHSRSSSDGYESFENIVQTAIAAGAVHIAITDHMDNMKKSDLERYVADLLPIKEKYSGKIYIAIGIECGWSKKNEQTNRAMLDTMGLEYIINSIHDVNGSDCYYQSHFDGRSKLTAYNDYFKAVLSSLSAPYKFHAVGHLSYITRTAPYENKKATYSKFSSILDEILSSMIQKDIILELNTNVYGSGTLSLPDMDIVKRYKSLGGKNITFSSDAHRIGRLFENYTQVAEKVKSMGFKEWTVVQNGVLRGIEI